MKQKLIEKANKIVIKDFKTKAEAKHYAHELSDELRKEEDRLMKLKRQIDDDLWHLRHAESKVFDYYLSIK